MTSKISKDISEPGIGTVFNTFKYSIQQYDAYLIFPPI